jgi:hypothetical protein
VVEEWVDEIPIPPLQNSNTPLVNESVIETGVEPAFVPVVGCVRWLCGRGLLLLPRISPQTAVRISLLDL